MQLYRFTLRPLSPWLTPWQSDTLSGLLCWSYARTHGSDVLRREILEPATNGHPPFVVSDAFPGDLLPTPLFVRLQDWPADQRKMAKRARWVTPQSFSKLQCGEPLLANEMITEDGIKTYTQLRNTIGRTSDTTAAGGSLFAREESVLASDQGVLSVYVRLEDSFVVRFTQLLLDLSLSGFGADVSAGKGQFEITSEATRIEMLDNPSPNTNGIAVLSTFQPSHADPTDGYWDTITKYGKLGPDFGLHNVFKRPFLALRPGACFRTPAIVPFVGRAIPMRELLADDVAAQLIERSANIIQLTFGLAVPITIPNVAQ